MVDDGDRRLLSHVSPPGWRNPTPASTYDLAVIGGGTAGLVCAAGAAGLGARVALVERARLGGDCLNTGCVPSKALLRSARVVGEMRAGGSVGVEAHARPDFAAVMRRLRARRADIAPNDSAARLVSLGVHVFFGTAAFTGPRTIEIRSVGMNDSGARTVAFRRAVIATGSRPSIPPIAGLAEAAYLTSDTVFDLTAQPGALVIIGGGAVGCELAQAFARLGTEVTLVEAGTRLLPHDDGEASAIVRRALEQDGVRVLVGAAARRVSTVGGRISVALDAGDAAGDALLVAVGRTPNVEDVGLDAAGIVSGREGVATDDRLRTSNSRVFASGDVCSRYKFTHAADAMSRIVVQNALFSGRKRASALTIPWCTFTSPEVGQVGMTGEQAAEAGAASVTIRLADVDRAIVDEERDGFVRVHHRRGRIAGATIVAPGAGELIGLVALAMQHGLGLDALAGAVLPYPTVAVALRQAGDAYRRQSLTPAVRRGLGYYFRSRRLFS